jgi:hypothetical protein
VSNPSKLLRALQKPETLITVVGVVIAVALTIVDIRNPSIDLMLPAVIFLLSALSVSQLIANYELTKRWEQLDSIEALQRRTAEGIETVATPFLQTRNTAAEPVRQRLARAKDVLIIGRTHPSQLKLLPN